MIRLNQYFYMNGLGDVQPLVAERLNLPANLTYIKQTYITPPNQDILKRPAAFAYRCHPNEWEGDNTRLSLLSS